MESDIDTRFVYYSVTTDNPFLPPTYVDKIRKNYDPKMVRRMVHGEWLEIREEVIYYAYDPMVNYIDQDFKVRPQFPIHIAWDFNIGQGKPLSLCLFQYIGDSFHVFDEVIVEHARTGDACDELAHRGLLDYPTKYYVNGDASGSYRDTRGSNSDYDIIKKYLNNYRTPRNQRLVWELAVPRSNPNLRDRHNKVNSYCKNDLGESRLFVYKKAKTVDKGLRLTSLKSGGQYVEDDSKPWQHVTTALGYGVCYTVNRANVPISTQGRMA
jgi:hypothetical protein